jgi:hypothetical protein
MTPRSTGRPRRRGWYELHAHPGPSPLAPGGQLRCLHLSLSRALARYPAFSTGTAGSPSSPTRMSCCATGTTGGLSPRPTCATRSTGCWPNGGRRYRRRRPCQGSPAPARCFERPPSPKKSSTPPARNLVMIDRYGGVGKRGRPSGSLGGATGCARGHWRGQATTRSKISRARPAQWCNASWRRARPQLVVSRTGWSVALHD